MKILLVANVDKEHVLKFHVPTIKMLSEHGWEVDVACAGDEEIPFVAHRYSMCWKRTPFSFKTLRGISQLKRIINENSYDIIYCHTPVGGAAARLAARSARKKGTKVIYCAHGFHFYKGAPILNWLIYYPIEKILSKMTDEMILINEEDYELAKKKFPYCKVHIIPGIGTDMERLRVDDAASIRAEYRQEMGISLNATVLIYLAELLPNKNQCFLMRVLRRVIRIDENVYLLLVGYDHSGERFARYAEQIGVKDHVRFLGWREDIGNLYASADICTATSIREGFGINLVEAMVCKVPVIASMNRGHVSIVHDGENGFLVPQNDEECFAKRILQLKNDPELRRRFISAGERDAKKYSSDVVLEKIDRILTDSLGS